MSDHKIIASIRPAVVTDCQIMATIYNAYLGYSTMDTEEREAMYYAQIIESLSEKERMYVMEIDESVIGWCIIKSYSDRIGYRTTCETSVYLHPAERSKGYGSQFKKFIIEECRELGYHHLVAKIMADNQVSIDYNLKLGYEIVGTQKEVGMVDGEWKDVMIMQLLL